MTCSKSQLVREGAQFNNQHKMLRYSRQCSARLVYNPVVIVTAFIMMSMLDMSKQSHGTLSVMLKMTQLLKRDVGIQVCAI